MLSNFNAFKLRTRGFCDGVECFSRGIGHQMEMKLWIHNLSSGLGVYPSALKLRPNAPLCQAITPNLCAVFRGCQFMVRN